ncbi:MAG: hypothetical protein NZT92_04200 [Abditibacteriales bacterium]|nr:hypothetical protein [Abditibacteriales bacterium]MDW8365169.1 hypothetical protein [Abditibacteriales bacterium]
MLRTTGWFGVGLALWSVVAGAARVSAAEKDLIQHGLAELIRSARRSAAQARVSEAVSFGQEVERGMVHVRYPLTIFHAGRAQHERWFARGAMMANLIYLSETAAQNQYLQSLATGSIMWLRENVTATGRNIEHVVGGEAAGKYLDAAAAAIRAGKGRDAAAQVAAAAQSLQPGFYTWYYVAGFTIATLQWDARLHNSQGVRNAYHSIDELLKQAPKAGAGDAVTASVEVHPGMHPSLRRLMSLTAEEQPNYREILQESTTIQSYAVT